jgi:hypothetical protein
VRCRAQPEFRFEDLAYPTLKLRMPLRSGH